MPSLFRRPLDAVFAAPSHVAVLRALLDSKEGMSGRAVARAAGVNHQACAVALKRLEAIGIVERRGSARTRLVRLNREHYLTREILAPALARERELARSLRRDLARAFSGRVRSAAIFGSLARDQASPGSDLDLILITESSGAAAADLARGVATRFRRRYGFRLSPIVMTARQARARAAKQDPLLANILRDAVDVAGTPLAEVVK